MRGRAGACNSLHQLHMLCTRWLHGDGLSTLERGLILCIGGRAANFWSWHGSCFCERASGPRCGEPELRGAGRVTTVPVVRLAHPGEPEIAVSVPVN